MKNKEIQCSESCRIANSYPHLLAIIALFCLLSLDVLSPLKYSRADPSEGQKTPDLLIYDKALFPISAEQISIEIEKNKNDPVALFQLIRQAAINKQSIAAFKTLDHVRKNDQGKKNAVVLAAFCFAFDMVNLPTNPEYPFTEEELLARDSALKEAYEIDPKLWLTYGVEGYYLSDKPGAEKEALSLLKKAVELAPDISITHYLLSQCYLVYDTPFQSPENAAEEAEKTCQLQPILSKGPSILMVIYVNFTPDRKKALEAKNRYLKILPPDFEPDVNTKKLLDQISP